MSNAKQNSIWDKLFFYSLDHNRYAIISIVLLIVGCMGGIAMWAGGVGSQLGMAMIIFPTMATLVLLLADQPLKWILNLAAISLILDLLLISYFLF